MEQISCDCCGRWFWAQDENQLFCPECKTTRASLRRWNAPVKGGDDTGKKIFDIIVAKRKQGVTTYDILKQLREKYGIKRNGVTNILSSLDRAGYLVYMDNNKLFPYKDTHTGVIYE